MARDRSAPGGADPRGGATTGPEDARDDALLDRVYAQLRAIAQHQMDGERPGHTLQATALVNEAYVRLVAAGVTWSEPAAFYHAAAEAMRRILIEHARKHGAVKRGGGRARLNLDVGNIAVLAEAGSDRILSLCDAIQRLEGADSRAASVVRLRFFAGLSAEEIGAALSLSDRTVKRDWEFARAWLYHAMASNEREPETAS